MTMWRLTVAALAAAMLCAPSAPAATVKTAKLARTTADYDVTIEYPQTGVAAIDADIAAWAKGQFDTFVRAAREHQADRPPYFLEIAPEVVRNDAQMFEVVFNISADQNWAHPSMDYMSLNYLLPDGARFLLAEALNPGGLKRISALAIADVNRRFASEGARPPDPQMLRLGASPYPESFQSFAFTKTELVLYFGSGQVDAYAVGPQEAHIALVKLSGVLRADWRAPMASFDCAKARSAIEKAICADRNLARLDRQVADAYSRALRNAELMARKPEEFRTSQRAFIAKRDKDCDGTGAAMRPCLAGAYRARLAVLQSIFE